MPNLILLPAAVNPVPLIVTVVPIGADNGVIEVITGAILQSCGQLEDVSAQGQLVPKQTISWQTPSPHLFTQPGVPEITVKLTELLFPKALDTETLKVPAGISVSVTSEAAPVELCFKADGNAKAIFVPLFELWTFSM